MILNRRCYILRCSQQWGISWNINWAGMMAAPCSLLVLLVAFGTNQLMNQSLRRQLGWNGDASSIHAPTTHLLNRTSVKYTFQHMPLNVYPCRLMAQFFFFNGISQLVSFAGHSSHSFLITGTSLLPCSWGTALLTSKPMAASHNCTE